MLLYHYFQYYKILILKYVAAFWLLTKPEPFPKFYAQKSVLLI
jgi:hypothetical protein